MKKVLIFVCALLICFLASCSEKEQEAKIDNDNNIESEEDNKYSSLSNDDFDVTKYEISEIPFVFVERLSRLANYKKETIGTTKAKVLITYTQKIHNVFEAFNDTKHLLTISSSTLVNVYHEAFFSSVVSCKDKETDDFREVSIEDYINEYGYLPYGRNLEGFELTEGSIINIEMTSRSDDSYIYHIVLDGNVGSNNLKRQMVKFGNLNDSPNFTSVEVDVEMKKDFTPIKIMFKALYSVSYPVLGNTNCTQEYEVIYSY